MLHASDPIRSLGFSTVPDGYSFMVATLDHEDAVAAARQRAVNEYGRELGALIFVGREGNSTEVVATLRSYPGNARRPFKASRHNGGDPSSPYAGLDPNALTDKVREVALSRKGMA